MIRRNSKRNRTENSIFFIDEENVFVHTVEFASCVKDSGNYFVLIIPAFAGFVDFVAVFAVECIFYGNQFML